MFWANFLHIYQPPTQTEDIVRQVTNECYRILVRILEAAPQARITLNINAVLTQQLERYNFRDVINGLRELAEKGQIEFTGSAIYHPILPLIPGEEIIRQIDLNTRVNRQYFGDVYQPKGFFPPEMCYNLELAKIVKRLGFQWIIVDEIACKGRIGSAKGDVIYAIEEADNLVVFFKERPISAGITYGNYPDGTSFLKALKPRLNRNCYLLTGTDGEVYGHHRPGQESLLEEIWSKMQPKTCTVTDLLHLFPKQETANPLPSSWSTWEDEMVKGVPYPQWHYPGHELHRQQWQLTKLSLQLVNSVPHNTPGYREARKLLDEGLHSCQYWWASCRPWWDTGMVEYGAQKLMDAIVKVQSAIPEGQLKEANILFNSIITTARQWQETGEAQRRKEIYLKEHQVVSSELTFGGGSL